MNKTFLVTRHEFITTVRRTGFIVMTLILPVLALLGIGIARVTSGISHPPAEITQIGYIDETGIFTQFTTQGNIEFAPYNTPESATSAIVAKEIKEYFVIPRDFLTTGNIRRFTVEREVQPSVGTINTINRFIISNLLNGKVQDSTIKLVESGANLVSIRITETGAVSPEQSSLTGLIIPGVFSLLLAMALSFSSAYVIQGLSEEKENRLMEILLSSISTRQLITGKVLGIGAAGLMQVIVWVISLPLLLNLASSSLGGFLSTIHVSGFFLVLGIIYFILGYLLYAVLSASVAAISPTMKDAQGLAAMFSLFSVAPFWFFSPMMFFPNNPIWVVFSIFPFSAPVETLLRIGMTGVPTWQIAVSLAVLVLSIAGGMLLAAKLLRTYILMYGKRPSLGEIIRSMRKS
jgi:ABC-2 type transport system permease protein